MSVVQVTQSVTLCYCRAGKLRESLSAAERSPQEFIKGISSHFLPREPGTISFP